ncbi:hypothetical protein [Oleispirillum naphthae]|uniref:hypothetical protein n=1 Tax=Oleispirillum naphthae TaxID=2838853 RepID=UPI003082428C
MFAACTRRRFVAGLLAVAPLAAFPGSVRAAEGPALRRGLVILAAFPGLNRPIDKEFAVGRFRLLDGYVRRMSYGAVGLEHRFTDWLQLPDEIGSYAISPANLEVDKSRVSRLVRDAVDAAGATEDFSAYDHVAIFLRAHFRDYGMVGLCGYPGMLGWSAGDVLKTRQGQVIPGGAAIFTSSAHLGTLFHDCAHIWGGVKNGKRVLPCLYDHDLQAQHPTRDAGWAEALINMGFWDPMSCHFIAYRRPPPGISSWTKLRLGWLPPGKVREVAAGQSAEILLGPLEDAASETLAIRLPLSERRYVLIENRQPIGLFDQELPGHGVLIMKADDNVSECRHGWSPVKLVDADPAQKYLNGAAFSLPGRDSYADAENGFEIKLVEKAGMSYRLRITRRAGENTSGGVRGA